MKKYSYYLLLALLISCTKTRSDQVLTIIEPHDHSVFCAGDRITVRWVNGQNTEVLLATLHNYFFGGITHEIPLVPINQMNGYLTTLDDGEEMYYLPWRYGDEGLIIYGDTIGTNSFKIHLAYAYQDSVGMWHEGSTVATSGFFAINPSTYPDGCTDTIGTSVTTGQECH